MRKNDLKATFKSAKKNNDNYIVVFIHMIDYPEEEMIINEKNNFENKLKYYDEAYNEELHLVFNDGIYITESISFNNFTEMKTIIKNHKEFIKNNE